MMSAMPARADAIRTVIAALPPRVDGFLDELRQDDGSRPSQDARARQCEFLQAVVTVSRTHADLRPPPARDRASSGRDRAGPSTSYARPIRTANPSLDVREAPAIDRLVI